MTRIALPEENQRTFALFVDWLHALFDDQFGVNPTAASSDSATLGLVDGAEVVVRRVDAATVECSISDKGRVGVLDTNATEALRRAEADDLGAGSWFQAHLSGHYGIGRLGVHMIRIASEEQLYRGHLRLGTAIGLEFDPGEVPPNIPRGFHGGSISLKLTLGVPGPVPGLFSTELARNAGTAVRAIASFATGIAFEGAWAMFPATREEAAASLANSVEFHCEGVELHSAMLNLVQPQNREGFDRLMGALYCTRQQSLSRRQAPRSSFL